MSRTTIVRPCARATSERISVAAVVAEGPCGGSDDQGVGTPRRVHDESCVGAPVQQAGAGLGALLDGGDVERVAGQRVQAGQQVPLHGGRGDQGDRHAVRLRRVEGTHVGEGEAQLQQEHPEHDQHGPRGDGVAHLPQEAPWPAPGPYRRTRTVVPRVRHAVLPRPAPSRPWRSRHMLGSDRRPLSGARPGRGALDPNGPGSYGCASGGPTGRGGGRRSARRRGGGGDQHASARRGHGSARRRGGDGDQPASAATASRCLRM